MIDSIDKNKLAPSKHTSQSTVVETGGIEAAGSLSWIVVNTLPHREAQALENLLRQGFETYCPMLQKRVRHARCARDVLRPLFASYLFVNVSRDLQRWRPIVSTLGVKSVVCFGNRPGFLDDGFIATLKAREVDGRIVINARSYQIGQQVRIEGGAFDGLVSTIVEMAEKDRLVVLMDILNRRVKVKVEGSSVTSV